MGIVVAVEQPEDPVRLVVHAAGSDPDVPGDRTAVCGLDTAGMAVDPWRPASPGQRWYPPDLARYVCPHCDQAVRSAS
ncbi:hypothetical protein ACFVFS_24185 [Kitasatospora sp. NPDC057692]|uniref:hypothetical protein n=1 Tax=Kitasatospora sp. NPDC057692 TaxID=3346215 RepID=UPI0036BF90B1